MLQKEYLVCSTVQNPSKSWPWYRSVNVTKDNWDHWVLTQLKRWTITFPALHSKECGCSTNHSQRMTTLQRIGCIQNCTARWFGSCCFCLVVSSMITDQTYLPTLTSHSSLTSISRRRIHRSLPKFNSRQRGVEQIYSISTYTTVEMFACRCWEVGWTWLDQWTV